MKNKNYVPIVAALCLAVAAPASAANTGYNPVLPIHPKLKSGEGQQTSTTTSLTRRIKPVLNKSADLVIHNASIRLAQRCHAGAPVLYVTARVQNVGQAASVAKLNVGMIQARDSANISWGNGHGLPVLAPGQTTSVSFPIYYLQSNPASMQGRHAFKLQLNAGKWIRESNYANNGFGPINVMVPAKFCGLSPDITSHKGPRIGGKFVAWGGAVTLGRSNAKRVASNGACVFEVSYQMSNDGKVATKPAFINRLRDGRMLSAVNSNLHLNAGETKTLLTEPTLISGNHTFSVSLDDGRAVSESNEGNNLFRVMVNVDKTCNNRFVRSQKHALLMPHK